MLRERRRRRSEENWHVRRSLADVESCCSVCGVVSHSPMLQQYISLLLTLAQRT